MNAPDEVSFKRAMRRWATGVAVLTTMVEGQQHAMTANSLTSVSLDPLLLLFSVRREARFRDAVLTSGSVGISVLAAEQEEAAQWFATRGRPLAGQLERYPYRLGERTGAPLLDGALATFEGKVDAVHPAGDHDIVVVAVLDLTVRPDGGPALVHREGRYQALD